MTTGTEEIPMRAISVETPTEDLREYLRSLNRREARLDATGITCPIKDNPEMSCLACPVSKANDLDDPKAALCRIGKAQEKTVAVALAQKHGR